MSEFTQEWLRVLNAGENVWAEHSYKVLW